MRQILGAILIALSFGYLGWRQARCLTERVWALKAFDSALEQMQRELEHYLTPLPQLMKKLGMNGQSPAKEFFAECGKALEGLDEEAFSASWIRLLHKTANIYDEDRRVLEPLGSVLGHCTGKEQSMAIEAVRGELQIHCRRAEEESRRLGSVYKALSVAVGGALIILLS